MNAAHHRADWSSVVEVDGTRMAALPRPDSDDRVPARHHRRRGRLRLDGARGRPLARTCRSRRPCTTPAASSSSRSSGWPAAAALHPQMVKIPGFLVDHLVVDPGPDADLRHALRPEPLAARCRVPISTPLPDPLTERRVIARRAAFELRRRRRRQPRRRHFGDDPQRRRRGGHRRADHADGGVRRHRRRARLRPRVRHRATIRARSSTSPISSTSTTAAG